MRLLSNPDTMNRSAIEALLDRYLKRETSAEEDQVVEKWLAENGREDAEWQKLDRSAKDMWLAGVHTDIRHTIRDAGKVVPLRSGKYTWYRIAGAAAMLLMVLGLYFGPSITEQLSGRADLNTVSVPEQQKRQVTLADGTTVWLNSGSELKYPRQFDGNTREVYLSGEAYFDVKHDAKKPFLIHTGKVLTTVLGTAFNIREDKYKHTVEVTVTRGKVSVADDGKLLSVLTANQQVSLDLDSRKSTEKTVDAKAVIAWQETEMLFDDITFADAAKQLEQHFHVKISFSNEKLKNCRFSGATLKEDKLERILDVISGFNNASWQKKADGQIIISGEGCN